MQKHSLTFLFALAVFFLLSSCAKIYYSPDAYALAREHQVVAIAPPKVSIAAMKKVDAEAIKEQQKTESTNFQQEMASWLLRRKMQNQIRVDIQDVETTRTLLQRAGYFEGKLLTPAEMCTLLGVDAVLTSNYALTKPMSEGGAVALGLLVGVWGATNQTTVTLEIYDGQNRKMIWNFNHKVSGSVGSSSAQLVDNLMRQASKKMPYFQN